MTENITATLQQGRADQRATLLRLAIGVMAVAALLWLTYEFWRLLSPSPPLWSSSPSGAVDLQLRHMEVQRWFAGQPIYRFLVSALYPPASYAMLWPLLGWLSLTPARWLWAITTVAALAWLVALTVRESRAQTRLERVFVALIPLSMYATGATIGNGQLIVHLLPMLMAGLLMVSTAYSGWREDLLAAALILLALVKPSISAPFFWIVLFVPGRWRPAFLVVLGYVLLTVFAASFQDASLLSLLKGWLGRAQQGAVWRTVRGADNLPGGLPALRLPAWNLYASLFVLGALGAWVYSHRRVDLWLLLGVTALVALFWSYHGWYDDLLVLLPIIALFRIAQQNASTDGSGLLAGVLLTLALLTTLAPGGAYLLPKPWNGLYGAGQAIVWTTMCIFLLHRAWREQRTESGTRDLRSE